MGQVYKGEGHSLLVCFLMEAGLERGLERGLELQHSFGIDIKVTTKNGVVMWNLHTWPGLLCHEREIDVYLNKTTVILGFPGLADQPNPNSF